MLLRNPWCTSAWRVSAQKFCPRCGRAEPRRAAACNTGTDPRGRRSRRIEDHPTGPFSGRRGHQLSSQDQTDDIGHPVGDLVVGQRPATGRARARRSRSSPARRRSAGRRPDQCRLDPLVDLRADAVAHPGHAGVVAEHRGGGATATSGLRRRSPGPGCAALLHAVEPAVVDVGEERGLADQVEIHLCDQVVLRREGGGGGRCDLGPRGDGTQRQVGGNVSRSISSRRAAPCGRSPWRRLRGASAPSGDRHHDIAGHMSKLSEGPAPGQAVIENAVQEG